MMDPLIALSLAGSVVQFIDFGSKLVSKSREIYQSADGTLSENLELETTTSNLLVLTEGLKDPSLSAAATTEELELAKICVSCRNIAEELLTKLNDLRTKGQSGRWKSFRAALKSVWSKEAVDELATRLASYRKQLQLGIMISLARKVDLQGTDFIKRIDKLDVDTQESIKGLLDEMSAMKLRLETPTQSTNHLVTTIADQHEQTRSVIIGEVRQIVQTRGYDHVSAAKTSSDVIAKAILKNHLQFTGMHDRREEVIEAFGNTFEWAYCDPSLEKSWSSFSSWLQEGQGVYWVNGKAGSGKSTLMRYLLDNSKTKECLRMWGGESTVDIASFFFWSSGTLEQRSLSGLRSILYDILRTKLHLVQHVLPEIWGLEELRLLGLPVSEIPKWTFRKLKQSFRLLAEQSLKLCLFIDGLDEYEGNFAEMADFCYQLGSFTNMKVCASSRPLVAFEEAFQGLPALRLHDLTYKDIETFIRGKLHSHKGMLDLERQEPERAPTLVKEIVEAANGVFLWVKLAVNSLLEGLMNRDRISDLQKRLHLLPRDLDEFYRMMFSSIPSLYHEHAAQLFQIARASSPNHPLTVQDVYFADETISPSAKAALKELSLAELEGLNETVNVQLKSHCVGFLEISSAIPDAQDNHDILAQSVAKTKRRVLYIHRSAKDFLETPDIWKKIISYTPRFNPHAALLRSCVLKLQTGIIFHNISLEKKLRSLWGIARASLICAASGEKSTGHAEMGLLDELDQTISDVWHLNCRQAGRDDLHWAHGYLHSKVESTLQCGNCTIKRPCNKSFLSLAIYYGADKYSLKKISEDPPVVKSAGEPLLHLVVRGIFFYGSGEGRLELILKLLQYGADPNLSYSHDARPAQSAWELALKRLADMKEFLIKNKEQLHQLVRILNVMSVYGGLPSGRIWSKFGLHNCPEQTETALEIIDRIFRKENGTDFPEAIELQTRLRARQDEMDAQLESMHLASEASKDLELEVNRRIGSYWFPWTLPRNVLGSWLICISKKNRTTFV